MCWEFVITSGAGTSAVGPTFRAIWRTQPRQICSCSRGAEVVRIADHAALAAAERDVHDGALPGHPHREGPDRVERLLRVEADPALARAPGVVVLHAEAPEDLARARRPCGPGCAKAYSRIGSRSRSRVARIQSGGSPPRDRTVPGPSRKSCKPFPAPLLPSLPPRLPRHLRKHALSGWLLHQACKGGTRACLVF